MLSIAICDDEILDLQSEKELIESVLSKDVKYEIDTFTSALEMLEVSKNYHIIFLDIEMNEKNGIETAEAIHKRSPISEIFFVTNHENYMDEALNKHAFRFWTKPMNRARLIYGINSAIKEINSKMKNITVNIDKKPTKIYMKDIIYIYHSERLTHIVTTKGDKETYDTFRSVTEQLSYTEFFETHKSCCVNLNYVSDYNKTDIICSHNGKDYNAFISKRKYTEFDERITEWSCEIK